MRLPEDDILYIDSKDLHEKETNALAVHPSKLNHLQKFEKESFHKVIIQNSKVEYFTALSFFQISRILKPDGLCEFYIDQPITVMQKVDAEQIRDIAKRKGFPKIKLSPFENWVKDSNGVDIKIETIKLQMYKN